MIEKSPKGAKTRKGGTMRATHTDEGHELQPQGEVYGPSAEDAAALKRLAAMRERLALGQAQARPVTSDVLAAAIRKGSRIQPPTPALEAKATFVVAHTVVDGVTALAARELESSTIARLAAKGRLSRRQVLAARRYFGLWYAAAFQPGVSTAFREPTGGGRGDVSERALEARDALHHARKAIAVVHRGAVTVVDAVVVDGETAAGAGAAEGLYKRHKSAEFRALALLEVGLNALATHFEIAS